MLLHKQSRFPDPCPNHNSKYQATQAKVRLAQQFEASCIVLLINAPCNSYLAYPTQIINFQSQQKYCQQCSMATTNDEYTSVDFLSKIRLQPKKNLFKHLSLDTDLEEINQMLSPKAKPLPPPEPNTIDRQLTKRFVMQLITKYESEGEAHAKWQGFLKSMDNAESFEVFVQSLKEIKDERKAEVGANPENENAREGEKKAVRSSSCKKIGFVKGVEKGRNNLREKMREEIGGLKDLLLAGQRFLRETVS